MYNALPWFILMFIWGASALITPFPVLCLIYILMSITAGFVAADRYHG